MAPLRTLFTSLLFLGAAHAHFSLEIPTSLEGDDMDDRLQPNAPCGGGNADLSTATTTDFHVDGDAILTLLGHPQATWLYRATLDPKAEGNWTQLFPIITQSGRGALCEPQVTAPQEWVGKKGFIGIACDAPDGMLFQCAAVNFVAGSRSTPEACANASSVSVYFDENPNLSALLDSSDSTSSTPTAPAATPSSSDNAAASLVPGAGLPIAGLAVSTFMLLVGAALL
ncbi:hypothetical protein VTJ49DRAFT_1134 [Mycothermus thermophilus]|uniref:Copper acquisition factor BIM1-like domain-containing protein n=1 Tax=Humicola insolens TaxID=85995 RepID=A0ABR3VRA6_HUMIN